MIHIALAALATLPAPQDFEYELLPPDREAWAGAGNSVAIEGEWAVVGGSSQDVFGPASYLPAMFRRAPNGRRWDYVQSLLPNDSTGFGQPEGGLSMEGDHLLVALASGVRSFRLDASSQQWIELDPLTHPSGPGTTLQAELVQVDGDRAIVQESLFGLGRIPHTYEFDRAADTWVWVDTLAPNSGEFLFRAWLDGDSLVTWADHDDAFSTPSQLWIHERSGQGWVRTQVIDGALLASTNPYFGGASDLEGNLLAIASDEEILFFERNGPGAPFIETGREPAGVYWSVEVESGVVFAGAPFSGAVDVWRKSPCLGDVWTHAHHLTTFNKHAGSFPGSIEFGLAIAADGDNVILGAPRFTIFNGPNHGRRAGAASIFHLPADLDGNGVEDVCQIQAFGDDVDGDGILDVVESPGSRYCSPNVPTSLGCPATILLQGSEFVSENRLVVTMLGVPQGAYGLMIAARQPSFFPAAGINDGNLCLGGGVGRRLGRTHSYWFAGADNVIHQVFDTSYSPFGPSIPLNAGETWFFQGWFRDGAASNMTDAMRIFFQ